MSSEAIKALLIEDNPGDQLLMREMLGDTDSAFLELECTDRLSTGLARLKAGDIDIVLLDLTLPDSMGLDTFIDFQVQAPRVPVIVLTGLDDEEVAVQAVREGAQDYLFKGQFYGDLLIRAIRYAIERKHTEETLRQRTIELQARNAELDAFAHTVAHDLKNPLGAIIGFADLLVRKHDQVPPSRRAQYLEFILQGSQKMSDIIEALLLLSQVRTREAELVPLDMGEIMAEVIQRLAPMIDQYKAELMLPDTWPVVLGYAPWIEEVWINYINNAIKYGGQPPHIEIGTSVEPTQVEMVRFWVQDNGPGLTSQECAQLFTPFTRLGQNHVEGHGLGLSIVQRIVEKIGGSVGVESEVGKGSTFSFTLPAAVS
jgi:signal transduction histidine kinase